MLNNIIENYLKDIHRVHSRGDAREESYYSAIERLVQVMAKWLKDRKGRALSLDDIRHYIRVAKALQLTIEMQNKIDKIYPQIEKKVIVFYN